MLSERNEGGTFLISQISQDLETQMLHVYCICSVL